MRPPPRSVKKSKCTFCCSGKVSKKTNSEKKKRNVKKIEKIVHPQMTAQDVGKDIFLNVEIKEKVFFHAKNIVR